MGTTRRVVEEASTYMAGLMGAAVLQFLAVPVFTRYLGPDQYSLLALSLAVSTSISGLLLVGGDLALSRFWFSIDSGHERRSLTVTWIAFLTAWSIPLVALACAAAPMISGWVSPNTSITLELQIAFVILVPAQLSRMLAQVLRNEFRPWPFAVTSTAIAGLSLVMGLWLAVGLGLGVAGVLLGSAVGESLGVLIRAPLVVPALRGSLSRRLVREPLLFGLPFVPASVAFWVFTGMDRIVVGKFMTKADLGAYAVAGMLVAPFTILLTALGQAWVPRITQEYEADSRQASRATGAGLELSLIAYGMAAVLVGACTPWLIRIISGPGYEAGEEALPLLAMGSALLGASLFASTGYTLAKRTRWVPVITIGAAALDVVLLWALVPRFGLLGAGAAVAASYFALSVGSLLVSQSYFPIPVQWGRMGTVVAVLAGVALRQSLHPGDVATWVMSAAALVFLATMGSRSLALLGRGEAMPPGQVGQPGGGDSDLPEVDPLNR